MKRRLDEGGQASAELVAIVPIVVAGALALGQLGAAGWALVSAGAAARAGARAAHVGAAPEPAARRAVPDALEPAEVERHGAVVRVRLRAPALIPGLPEIPVTAAAGLDPAAGSP